MNNIHTPSAGIKRPANPNLNTRNIKICAAPTNQEIIAGNDVTEIKDLVFNHFDTLSNDDYRNLLTKDFTNTKDREMIRYALWSLKYFLDFDENKIKEITKNKELIITSDRYETIKFEVDFHNTCDNASPFCCDAPYNLFIFSPKMLDVALKSEACDDRDLSFILDNIILGSTSFNNYGIALNHKEYRNKIFSHPEAGIKLLGFLSEFRDELKQELKQEQEQEQEQEQRLNENETALKTQVFYPSTSECDNDCEYSLGPVDEFISQEVAQGLYLKIFNQFNDPNVRQDDRLAAIKNILELPEIMVHLTEEQINQLNLEVELANLGLAEIVTQQDPIEKSDYRSPLDFCPH